jgi:hypothetical protein
MCVMRMASPFEVGRRRAEWTNGNLKRPQCITKSCAWRAHKSDDDDDSIKSMFSPSVLHAMPGRIFYDGVAAARLNISFRFTTRGAICAAIHLSTDHFGNRPSSFCRLLFISVAPIDIARRFFCVRVSHAAQIGHKKTHL